MLTPEAIAARRETIIGPRFLPVTATYPTFGDRKYQMTTPYEGYIGHITISQGKKSESYLFDEDEEYKERPGTYGRSFQFGRVTGAATVQAAGFYRVTIPPGNYTGGCECIGYSTAGLCKHVHTVLDLLTIKDGPLWLAEYDDDERRRQAEATRFGGLGSPEESGDGRSEPAAPEDGGATGGRRSERVGGTSTASVGQTADSRSDSGHGEHGPSDSRRDEERRFAYVEDGEW